VLFVLALVTWAGDLWWPATLLEFTPGLAWLAPLAVLAAWNLRARRWPIAAAHLAIALVILGPLMGLRLPLGRLLAAKPEGTAVRVMTFNRGADRFDPARLMEYLRRERIDVLCFQEPGNPPYPEITDPGLRAFFDEGWYHNPSWTILSRFPLEEEKEPVIGELPAAEFWPGRVDRAVVVHPSGREFRVACVHLPTIRFGLRMLRAGQFDQADAFLAWRRRQAEALVATGLTESDLPALVAGDFNAPFSSPMFDRIRGVLHEGFESAGLGYPYTRPASWPWIGIDYVLATPEWAFRSCWVGPDLGSDHRPVVAEVVLTDPPAGE
jgi:endonuclease/exonuclease/phosphatase family metal-dependent hydrolase